MPTENLVSIEISEKEIAQVNDAIAVISNTLKPYLITLKPEQRQSLPKMSDQSIPFVNKALEYSNTHPEFAPGFVSLPELKKDIAAFEQLRNVARRIEEVQVALEDTSMLAGSEAYVATLSYYNNTKQAVKQNIPGAKVVYDDLKKRFEDNGNRNNKSSEEDAKQSK